MLIFVHHSLNFEGVPVLSRSLWSCVPSIVNRVRGGLVSAAKTKVGVDGLDVECDDFSALVSDDEGKGDIGTKHVPEDVSKKRERDGGDVKDEEEKELKDHTNIQYL